MIKILFWIGFATLFLFMLYLWLTQHLLQSSGIYFINFYISIGILVGYLLLYYRSKRDIDYEVTLGMITALNVVIIFSGGEHCLSGFFASFNIGEQCFGLQLSFEGVFYALPFIVFAICFIEAYLIKSIKSMALAPSSYDH